MKKGLFFLSAMLLLSSCAQADNTDADNSAISETFMLEETTVTTEIEMPVAQETTITTTITAIQTTTETTAETEPEEPKEIMYKTDKGVTVIDLELLSKEYTDNTLGENSGHPILVENCGSDNILVYFQGKDRWYGYIADVSDGSLKSLIPEITEYGDIDFSGSGLRDGRYYFYFGKTEKGNISDEKIIEIFGDGNYSFIDEMPAHLCGNHIISYRDRKSVV